MPELIRPLDPGIIRAVALWTTETTFNKCWAEFNPQQAAAVSQKSQELVATLRTAPLGFQLHIKPDRPLPECDITRTESGATISTKGEAPSIEDVTYAYLTGKMSLGSYVLAERLLTYPHARPLEF